jgi:hypothetical protein
VPTDTPARAATSFTPVELRLTERIQSLPSPNDRQYATRRPDLGGDRLSIRDDSRPDRPMARSHRDTRWFGPPPRW